MVMARRVQLRWFSCNLFRVRDFIRFKAEKVRSSSTDPPTVVRAIFASLMYSGKLATPNGPDKCLHIMLVGEVPVYDCSPPALATAWSY
jgi:hypothetical protein